MRGQVRVSAECSATHAVITFVPWGRCTITVDADSLLLSVEANDRESFSRIQNVIASDLERWGTRENLQVLWSTVIRISPTSSVPNLASDGGPEGERPEAQIRAVGRHQTLLITTGALGITLILVVHLTLAGVIVSVPLWLGWTAAGVALLPALMLAVHALGPLTIIGLLRHTFRRARPRPAVSVALTGEVDGQRVVQRHNASDSRHV